MKAGYLGDFLDGKFVPVEKGDGILKDISPADLSDLILTAPYSYQHVDRAVEAAKKAYPSWSRLPMLERKKYLLRLREAFEGMKAQFTEAISRDTGKPTWDAAVEANELMGQIDITLNYSLDLVKEERVENALPAVDGVVRYRSRGVMAVIGPFNFPARLPCRHIVPALIMGNSVVFKPSEQTPFVGQMMAQAFEKAEFPAGVFNLVQGDGETGRKIVTHEAVDGILFTGSYEIGLKIKQETVNHYWKILALEMGGKNATVIWNDADMDKAIYETLLGAYMTTGQRCTCTSRIIVHEDVADNFTERFYEAAKKLTVGHWSENPFMGPLINAQAVEKYVRFQEIANRENCESLMRGKQLDLKHKGHYVTPSIHLVKKFEANSVYQKSEIFGPNVAIFRTRDFDETMKIVNSTGYGLVMSLFSKSRALYEEAQAQARVGVLNWNRTTNGISSRMPFGGMGKSGNDRPSAHFAVQYCTIPVASLEDMTAFDPAKKPPGMTLEATKK